MNNKVEGTLKDISKFLEEKKCNSSEEVKAALNEFMALQNEAMQESREPDEYDYLEMAQDAESEKDAIRYAKKALDLAPTMLDAEYIIISHESKDVEDMQSRLEKLLKKGERQLKEQGITRDNNTGMFYSIFETRPYMRIYFQYLDTLLIQGKIHKAIDVCKEILYLNGNDNMGARYHLLALYATLEDKEAAEELYRQYEAEGGSLSILPMIALYYRLDDEANAKRYLDKLCKWNKDVKQGFEFILRAEPEELAEMGEMPYYRVCSIEELIVAFVSNMFLYSAIPGFVPWVLKRLPVNSKRTRRNGQSRSKSKKKH